MEVDTPLHPAAYWHQVWQRLCLNAWTESVILSLGPTPIKFWTGPDVFDYVQVGPKLCECNPCRRARQIEESYGRGDTAAPVRIGLDKPGQRVWGQYTLTGRGYGGSGGGRWTAPGGVGVGSVNAVAYGGGGGGGSAHQAGGGAGGCGGSSGGANGGGGGSYAGNVVTVTPGQGYGFAAGGIVRQCECLPCKQHRAGVNRWEDPMSKVGVIGSAGVVGSAQVRMFSRRYEVIEYDPKTCDEYPEKVLAECEFIVVCVPTPPNPDGTCDLSYLDAAMERIPRYKYVIIRSTVPVGTTEAIAKDRMGWTLHWPEFMHESPAGAWHESYDVPFAMIGGVENARNWFIPRVSRMLPDALICGAESEYTELTKLVANSYWAVKIAFVNHVEEICEQNDMDYAIVRDMWLTHPQVDPAYTQMDGFARGFGGACLPKDLADLAQHLPKPNLFSVVSRWNNRGAALPMD